MVGALKGEHSLDTCQQRCSRQQPAQDDRSRDAGALVFEIELLERVLAQGNERDATEVGECLVLEEHPCQVFGALAGDVIEADAAKRECMCNPLKSACVRRKATQQRLGQSAGVSRCQRLLTLIKAVISAVAAYPRRWIVELALSAWARCLAPSGPMRLLSRLKGESHLE